MTLNNQCCTIGQATRLKELGIEQTSVACFIGTELHLFEKSFYNWAEQKNIAAVAAFTVAELGVMLPPQYNDKRLWDTVPMSNTKISYCEVHLNGKAFGAWKYEAEGRAALLIHLLENNITTVQEVNTRLSAQNL